MSQADAGEDERISEDLFSEADEGNHEVAVLMREMICSGVSSTEMWPPSLPDPHVIEVMSGQSADPCFVSSFAM